MKKIFLTLLIILVLLASVSSLAACDENDIGEGHKDPYLVLVNKEHAVGPDHVPDELIDVDTVYTTGGKVIQLNRVALLAATDMLDAMYEDGITNVTITSAYRTYDYQKKLFDGYIAAEKEAHPDWTDDRVRQEVLTYSAAPGTSEHQTGLCVDLFTTDMAGLYNFGTEYSLRRSPRGNYQRRIHNKSSSSLDTVGCGKCRLYIKLYCRNARQII